MFTWEKTGKVINSEGTTVTYTAKENPEIKIESRKRKIPHNAKPGFWWHTTYMVMLHGEDEQEKWTLKDAKEWADKLDREAD